MAYSDEGKKWHLWQILLILALVCAFAYGGWRLYSASPDSKAAPANLSAPVANAS